MSTNIDNNSTSTEPRTSEPFANSTALKLALLGAAVNPETSRADALLFVSAGKKIAELELELELERRALERSSDSIELNDRANRVIHHCLGLYNPDETDCGHFEGERPPTVEEVDALMILISASRLSATVTPLALITEVTKRTETPAYVHNSVKDFFDSLRPKADAQEPAPESSESESESFNAHEAAVEGATRPSAVQAGKEAVRRTLAAAEAAGLSPETVLSRLRERSNKYLKYLNEVLSDFEEKAREADTKAAA